MGTCLLWMNNRIHPLLVKKKIVEESFLPSFSDIRDVPSPPHPLRYFEKVDMATKTS